MDILTVFVHIFSDTDQTVVVPTTAAIVPQSNEEKSPTAAAAAPMPQRQPHSKARGNAGEILGKTQGDLL